MKKIALTLAFILVIGLLFVSACKRGEVGNADLENRAKQSQQEAQPQKTMMDQMNDPAMKEQMMNQMMNDPAMREQMMDRMMNDPTMKEQMMNRMMNNPEFCKSMMDRMMGDSGMRQHMEKMMGERNKAMPGN